jgi:hypothetical protein
VTGCRPGGPLTVTTIQVGRSLNSDDSVGALTTTFKPDDTMYVAVITGGPGSGTLTARWRWGGRLVSEESRDVSYREQAATEFHIQNSGGFPPGDYSVEVLLDGMSVGTRTFRVQ